MDEGTELPDGYEAYCPVCDKVVDYGEIMPVVCECTVCEDGSLEQVVNRAFHFPGCKKCSELVLREITETTKTN